MRQKVGDIEKIIYFCGEQRCNSIVFKTTPPPFRRSTQQNIFDDTQDHN